MTQTNSGWVRSGLEHEYRRLTADESPFVTQEVQGDNAMEYTPWYAIERPYEWAEMEERLCYNRLALFAARVADYDEYLTRRAARLHDAGLIEAAILLLSLRNDYRDLWAGPYRGRPEGLLPHKKT